jgi:hypothetical protein
MTEADLAAQFVTCLPIHKARTAAARMLGPVVRAEFWAGEGVADLVQAWLAPDAIVTWPRAWWEVLQSATASALFTHLQRRRRATADELAALRGATRGTVRHHLADMVRAGLVDEDAGLYAITPLARSSPASEIWGFEFKLHDWQRAMYQALRYRAFAHYVAICLPMRHADSVASRASAVFRRFGVGLIGVSEAVGARFAVGPRKCSPRSRVAYTAALARLAVSGTSEPNLGPKLRYCCPPLLQMGRCGRCMEPDGLCLQASVHLSGSLQRCGACR